MESQVDLRLQSLPNEAITIVQTRIIGNTDLRTGIRNLNPSENINLNPNENINNNLTLKDKNIKNETKDEEIDEGKLEFTKTEWCILVTIGITGWLIQPLYLLFYILYGIMECYRRFNCWFYYGG